MQGISDIITIPGIINRDFADVKAIMAGMGYAVMGTATAKGERRAIEAAQRAIASPLLEAGAIDGARGILINITGSSSLRLAEVNEASTIIQNAAHEDANIIFGAVLDEKMKDEVKITVIATGFQQPVRRERSANAAANALQQSRTAAVYERPDPPVRPRAEAPSYDAPLDEFESSARVIQSPAASEPAPMARIETPVHDLRNVTTNNYGDDDLDVPAFIRKRQAAPHQD